MNCGIIGGHVDNINDNVVIFLSGYRKARELSVDCHNLFCLAQPGESLCLYLLEISTQ